MLPPQRTTSLRSRFLAIQFLLFKISQEALSVVTIPVCITITICHQYQQLLVIPKNTIRAVVTINFEMSDWKHSTFLCKGIKSKAMYWKSLLLLILVVLTFLKWWFPKWVAVMLEFHDHMWKWQSWQLTFGASGTKWGPEFCGQNGFFSKP